MGLKKWCEGKCEVEKYGDDWECDFKNGTELRKEGNDFVAKVLPKEHHDEPKHIKDVFRSENPKIKSEDTLMFGAEKVQLHEGVLVSVPRK